MKCQESGFTLLRMFERPWLHKATLIVRTVTEERQEIFGKISEPAGVPVSEPGPEYVQERWTLPPLSRERP
jgi:hypothetical protein